MSPDNKLSSITLTRASIIDAARCWLGTPFRHQGRNSKGIDCVGLIIETARALNLIDETFDYTNYSRRPPHGQAFMKHFADYLVSKNCRQYVPGDIVALKEPAFPCHCGIIGVLNKLPTLIHAYSPRGQVVEEYFDTSKWRALHVATYEFPGTQEWHS